MRLLVPWLARPPIGRLPPSALYCTVLTALYCMFSRQAPWLCVQISGKHGCCSLVGHSCCYTCTEDELRQKISEEATEQIRSTTNTHKTRMLCILNAARSHEQRAASYPPAPALLPPLPPAAAAPSSPACSTCAAALQRWHPPLLKAAARQQCCCWHCCCRCGCC